MTAPGDALLTLAAQAREELLIVAPFVKRQALNRVLQSVSQDVRIRCVTRWDPVEIVAGVSDLEVWELAQQHPKMELRLSTGLHVKLYRADERCLVGSANVTGGALGWAQPANLELLVEVSEDLAVQELVASLKRSSVIATKAIYDAMLRSVESLRVLRESGDENLAGWVEAFATNIESWLPACRAPGRLYSAYRGREDRMIASAYADAQRDLSFLRVPDNLDRAAFTAYVTALLEQHPVILRPDAFVATLRGANEIEDLLAESGVLPEGATAAETWDSLKLWLLTFFRTGIGQSLHREPGFSSEVAC